MIFYLFYYLQINDAWTRLADTMGIPIPDLKKKKETLMTAFRLNLKKKQASMSSGAGEEDIFKPVWIFYDALESFLRNKYECKSIITTEDEVRK